MHAHSSVSADFVYDCILCLSAYTSILWIFCTACGDIPEKEEEEVDDDDYPFFFDRGDHLARLAAAVNNNDNDAIGGGT